MRYLHKIYVIQGLRNGRPGQYLYAVLSTQTLCLLDLLTVHAITGAQVNCRRTWEYRV